MAQDGGTEIARFERRDASSDDINSDIAELLDEVRSDPSGVRVPPGYSLDVVKEVLSATSATEQRSGFAAGGEIVIAVAAAIATEIAKGVWKDVIAPWIQNRRSPKSVQAESTQV